MPARPILLTGFEPFGGDAVNPSWDVARAIGGAVIDGVPVVAVCLPCVFGRAIDTLQTALQQHRPQLVLALGLAANRAELSVERVAINVDDARIADNAAARPVDEPVVAGGPAAYFSTLPIKAIAAQLQAAGLPAAVSQTAGTFVCNHVFYGLMHLLRRRRGVRGGFMHLPLLPEQAASLAAPGLQGLALASQVAGVRLALQTALRTQADWRRPGGAIA